MRVVLSRRRINMDNLLPLLLLLLLQCRDHIENNTMKGGNGRCVDVLCSDAAAPSPVPPSCV